MATANEENLRISITYIIVEQRVMVLVGRRYCRGHGRSLDDQREDALREFAERVAEFCAAHIDNADPNAADKIRDAFGFRNREARCEEIVDGYRRLRKAERLKEEPQHQEQTMCGRYKLEADWQEYCANPFLFDWEHPPYPTENPFSGSDEVFPRNRMPIIRRHEDGKLRPELRQWGFILMVNGKTIDPATGKLKRVRRDVFNAMSEKLTTGSPGSSPSGNGAA